MSKLRLGLSIALFFVVAPAAAADGDPSNYEALVPTLQPGDTLTLAPGTYTGNLDISGLNGTEAMPIVIEGPADRSAVFTGNGCCNTVEISNSSYVVVRNLTIDGQGLDGVFGVSAKDGASNVVHHITIEGCDFVGQGASQQTVAISTKAPTWGWVIRKNRITGAGTGMYLGNSDGTQPFVAGVIDGNLIQDTIGYNAQIKFQTAWPPGVPSGTSTTIIRNNVFIKNDDPSPDGDRPNLLVGGFPESGPGSDDVYEIYGNFFFHNPREAHLQASGRVTIHDNVFVDAVDAAVVVTDHDLPLRRAHVYDNTFYAVARGIAFGNAASESDFVVGNLVFGGADVSGPAQSASDNLLYTLAEAPVIVAAPSLVLGQMDFYPLPGQAQGAPLDMASVAAETDADIDFNGSARGDYHFRGAYAGEGDNPGWQLDADLKEGGGMGATTGAGGAGATSGGSGGAAAAAGTGGSSSDETGSGAESCSCRVGARGAPSFGPLAVVALAALGRRRSSQRLHRPRTWRQIAVGRS